MESLPLQPQFGYNLGMGRKGFSMAPVLCGSGSELWRSCTLTFRFAVSSSLAAGLAVFAGSEPIQFQPAALVQANGSPLNPGGQVIPCVVDWNNDALPDLVVGYQPAFKVAVYLNSGNGTQPVFTSSNNLQAAGADIYLPSGGCGSPAPWVCDFDDDGRKDLLAGDGSNGKVYFYRNINTDANAVLTNGVALMMNGSPLSVTYRATPYVHDWDEDGLPDLLCGDGNGYVHWFRNVGTRQSPVYTSDVLIQAGGLAVNFGARSSVRVCDWDGDGVKDLVGSGSNNAAWCRNIGNNGSPVLAGLVRLHAPLAGLGLAKIDTGYRMRLEIIDWNQDGLCDLLIGNWDGYLHLYQGYRFALLGVIVQPDNNFMLRWSSADHLKYELLCGGAPDSLRTLLASNLPSAGKTTCWTNERTEAQQFFRVRIAASPSP